MQWLLTVFGSLFVIVIGAVILFPFLRGRSDLLSTWNLFLFGSINFIGISAIQSGIGDMHAYTIPDDSDYVRFVLGGITFYTVGLLTYRFFNFPSRLAARMFQKWAPQDTPTLLTLAVVCLLLVLGYLFVPNVQVLGQLLIFIGLYASTFGFVFLLYMWNRRPFNVVLLGLCCVPLLIGAIITNTGFGRRDFLSVLLALPISLYWLRWRYQPPMITLVKMATFAAIGFVVLAGISITRGMRQDPSRGVVGIAIDKLRAIPGASQSEGAASSVVGGDTTEASLAAIHHYSTIGEPEPFFTLYYVLVHPIPRPWWPGKPVALGVTLPVDIGHGRWGSGFSLGPGIIGHGFHEGGLHMLAFYGFLFASMFRFFDELLVRRSDNVFLLGIFCAVSGQIVAFSRGDVGLFTVLLIAGIMTGLLLNRLGRLLFGTEQPYVEHDQSFPAAVAAGEVY